MSGTQTKGFDTILEISESVISDAVAQYLSYEGSLCRLGDHMISQLLEQLAADQGAPPPPGAGGEPGLSDIPGMLDDLTQSQKDNLGGMVDGTVPTPHFLCFPDEVVQITADVELPLGVTLPSTVTTDTITINAFVRGEEAASLRLELVVGIGELAIESDDLLVLDFQNGLHHGEATLTVSGEQIQLDLDQIRAVLQNLLEPLPLLPIPVDRTTEDPAVLKRVDFFTIDDHFAADRDALALGMTFGGGTPGRPDEFTQAVIPDGSTGALMMSQPWLCRLIGGRIESELGLTETSFTEDGCTFEGERELDVDGETLVLTRVSLTAHDGYLELAMHLYKDDGCAEATVDAAVRIRAGIEGGELVLSTEVLEPDVTNNTPWWCYLVGAIVGAVTGAVLGIISGGGLIGAIVGGVIGAVVGVVLVFLIDIVSDPVGDLADSLSDVIGNTVNGLRVSAPALAVVPIDAFIDDVTVALDVRVNLPYPVRGEGTATIRGTQGIDLDRGAVLPEDAGGVDVVVDVVTTTVDLPWPLGSQSYGQAQIKAICGAAVAASGTYEFEAIGRYQAGRLPYIVNGLIGPSQLSGFFGGITSALGPSRQVIGIRSNEGRFAIIQVTSIRPDEAILQWRTWESPSGNVAIHGGFSCGWGRSLDTVIEWEVADRAPRQIPDLTGPRLVGALHRGGGHAAGTGRATGKPVRRTAGSHLQFSGRIRHRRSRTGHFEAVLDRPNAEATAVWRLDGVPLLGPRGVVTVDGQSVEFEVEGNGLRLTLRVEGSAPLTAWLEVDVETTASPAHSATCIEWTPTCSSVVSGVPPLALWRRLAGSFVGAVRVEGDREGHDVTFGWRRPGASGARARK